MGRPYLHGKVLNVRSGGLIAHPVSIKYSKTIVCKWTRAFSVRGSVQRPDGLVATDERPDKRLVAPPRGHQWSLKSAVHLPVELLKKSCDADTLFPENGTKMRIEPRSS